MTGFLEPTNFHSAAQRYLKKAHVSGEVVLCVAARDRRAFAGARNTRPAQAGLGQGSGRQAVPRQMHA